MAEMVTVYTVQMRRDTGRYDKVCRVVELAIRVIRMTSQWQKDVVNKINLIILFLLGSS